MRPMKDSGIEWIGEIPEGWDVVKNKWVMHKKKLLCEKYGGENILSLTMKGVIIRNLDNPTGKMPLTFDGYQFLYEGNLLMCLFDIDVTPRSVGLIKNIGVTSPASFAYTDLSPRYAGCLTKICISSVHMQNSYQQFFQKARE